MCLDTVPQERATAGVPFVLPLGHQPRMRAALCQDNRRLP